MAKIKILSARAINTLPDGFHADGGNLFLQVRDDSAANLSQKKLGIAVGMDELSASARTNHCEKGRHSPDYSMLKRIAKVLKLPVAYLYSESDDLADLIQLYSNLKKADKISFLKKTNAKLIVCFHMKKKIKEPRSHRRCPCGSRKKYKNCCYKKIPDKKFLEKAKKHIEKKLATLHIADQYHQEHFGHASEIMTCQFNDRRYIVIGDSLITSDDPNRDWQSPTEFLISHLKASVGNDWFDQQFQLGRSERHLIATWLLEAKFAILDENDPIESTQLNGSAFSFLHLAYDLFVINNHGCLTDKKIATRLIEDLKNMNNFNGARYEIFVFATLIRAGFELKLHDQLDGTSGRVTECQATHIKTQTIIQIKAKTRNIRGVLGAVVGKRHKIRLYDKLRDAIEKDVTDPYIIFLDLNFEKFNVVEDSEKLDKVREEYNKLQEKYSAVLPNIVCFTNIPYHCESNDPLKKNSAFGLILSKKPRIQLENEAEIFNSINNALSQHRYLPSEFDESSQYAKQWLKNSKDEKNIF